MSFPLSGLLDTTTPHSHPSGSSDMTIIIRNALTFHFFGSCTTTDRLYHGRDRHTANSSWPGSGRIIINDSRLLSFLHGMCVSWRRIRNSIQSVRYAGIPKVSHRLLTANLIICCVNKNLTYLGRSAPSLPFPSLPFPVPCLDRLQPGSMT